MIKGLYKHVAVIGIDGMGGFNAKTPTPRMDGIFERGAYTYTALSMDPTISAENWGAMLLGATPAVHGLTNSIVGRYRYKNDALPSVFKRLRAAYPDAYLASCCNWNPINFGIIEEGIGVDKYTKNTDEELTADIEQCVAKKPLFLFVQFDDVDGAGHGNGYGMPGHLNKITQTDTLVGRVYDAYAAAGILQDTLFIAIADHGGFFRGHGGYTDGEKYVFFAAAGNGTQAGELEFARTADIAAVVLYALGLPLPEYNSNGFCSQVPDGMFAGKPHSYIRVQPVPNELTTRPTPSPDGAYGLKAAFPGDKIKLALFMDNEVRDITGKCGVKEYGTVKYYSTGVYGARAELGCVGHADISGIDLAGSFTLAVWLRTDASLLRGASVCGTMVKNEKGRDFGMYFALRCHSTVLRMDMGEDDFEAVTAFPDDAGSGWIHAIAAFDTQKREARLWYNFKYIRTVPFEEDFEYKPGNATLTVGGYGPELCEDEDSGVLVNMDDLIIFDGAFTEQDAEKLAEYYK